MSKNGSENGNRLRQLPSVDRLLRENETNELVQEYGRDLTREALRMALGAARQWIRQGGNAPGPGELLRAAPSVSRTRQTSTLRPAITATGVTLHTPSPRTPLPK